MYQTYMEQSKSKEASGNVEAVTQEICILLTDSIKLCYFEWCFSW